MLAENLRLTDDPLVRRGRGKNHKAYRERTCKGCGQLSWITEQSWYCSKACSKRGASNPHWAGDDAEYGGRHSRIRRGVRGSADHCIHRNAIGCTDPWFEWAHIHGTDPLDAYNYVAMCKACHSFYDRTSRQGSNHYRAELNDEIVFECRRRHYLGGESYAALARKFDVTKEAMRDAASIDGNTWRHVPWPEGISADLRPKVNVRGSQHPDAKLTEEIVAEARARTAAGESMRALAREYGIGPTSMRNAIIGKTWTHVPMPQGVPA